MVKRNWEDNAKEFAELDKGEGWPFAVLVACSVSKLSRGKPKANSSIDELEKVSASKFAAKAGTSDARIARYLAAWQKAAAAGIVPGATTLKPDDVARVKLPNIPWSCKPVNLIAAS